MSLQEVIRTTLILLKDQGRPLTPQNYSEAFCKEAKKSGLVLEECNPLDKFISRLEKPLQKELREYHLRNTDEFFSYLIGKLNRLVPESSHEELRSMTMLIRRMAQVAMGMHDVELTKLAEHTLEHIEHAHTSTSIDHLKNSWLDFLTTYDDSFLDRLSVYGKVDKENLRATVHRVVDDATTQESEKVPNNFSRLLTAALVPSIASSMNDEIAVISSQLRQDPDLLETQGMVEDIQYAIRKRIELDKAALKDTVYQLDEIAGEVSNRLISIIEQSETKKEELTEIRKKLESLDVDDKSSHIALHQRLLQIALLLEKETGSLNEAVKTQQAKISTMDQKILLLEDELSQVSKQSRLDYLTGTYNKMALEEKLRELDAQYKRFGRDFSILFIDIDHFKKINDSYGHDAGDVVLKIFGKVLRKESRDIDFVARYGGEEFVIVLPETSLEGTKRFATKLRLILEKNRFVYKDKRLKLTVSGGIGQRSDYDSVKEQLIDADAKLYKAKDSGRNIILPQ